MDDLLHAQVIAAWASALGVELAQLVAGGVHVVGGDPARNLGLSALVGDACVFVVKPDRVGEGLAELHGVDARAAFTPAVLCRVIGTDAQVDGPSVHHFVDAKSFLGYPDSSAERVDGSDPALISFLRANDLGDWAEAGFPEDPATADVATTAFWLLRDGNGVVAAGNMTEWRGQAADVGLLTSLDRRGNGFAERLAGAMVADALSAIEVVRYRALATNTASLAIAHRLGFRAFGQNFRARRRAI